MPSSLNGTGVTFNDATTLQSGNIPAANLGTGTANSTTFLRGDKTWAVPGAAAPVVNTFNSSGTWTKPSTGTMARIQVWGGGGGANRGAGGTDRNFGGGGGAYAEIMVPLSTLASSVTVTVGAGGAGRTGSAGPGGNGGTSSFGTLIDAFGGGGATYPAQYVGNPGGGGGTITAGSGTTDGIPMDRTWSGGRAANLSEGRAQASSVFGGGGGARGEVGGTNGLSKLGGNGGDRNQAGVQPGGGGGANSALGGNGFNGAAGRVVVTVW
jgi:hypothetical protein